MSERRKVNVVLRVTLAGELCDPSDPDAAKLSDGEIALALKAAVANELLGGYQNGYTHELSSLIAVSEVPTVEFCRGPCNPQSEVTMEIVAEISGGNLQNVYATEVPGVKPDFTLVDYDNIEGGDEPPIEDVDEYVEKNGLKSIY